MNWNPLSFQNDWPESISNRPAKEELGRRLASYLRDGQVIGVGSGSTSYIAIQAIAVKIRSEKLRISAVCTSLEVELACAMLGVPIASFFQSRPDWYFDGADEVDPNRNLIKGRGGAMFREKLIMSASPKTFILVDQSKLVATLGSRFPIPVEVFPPALRFVESTIRTLGATEVTLRQAKQKDGPVITEGGNIILDVRFPKVELTLERDLKMITGVIESGLFIGKDVEIIAADSQNHDQGSKSPDQE